MAVVDQRAIVLQRGQAAERLPLALRFGVVNLARPQSKFLRHLPESLPLTVVMCGRSILRLAPSRCSGGF